MRFIGKALLGLLAITGLIAIIVVGGTWLIVRDMGTAGQAAEPMPERFVIQLPLEHPFPEHDPALPFLDLAKRDMALRDVVDTIDRAAGDPRVVGLIGTVAESGRSLAQAQEIRAAVARFQATGKPTVAFSDSLGESTAATIDYMLASGFERVVLQPSGMVALTGFGTEVPFARSALEDLGISANYGRRWEYKNAVDSLVRDEMSDAHRASMAALLGDMQDQAAADIAAARDMPVAAVRDLMNGMPLMAQGALDAGLVDDLGYWRDTLEALNAAVGTTESVDLARYANASAVAQGGAKIALVEAIGAIQRGTSEPSPVGGPSAGGDTVAEALRDAVDDADVRAIILRIDSPGGSYVASDTVWHEVRRAREKDIPVIASLGGVAASGGYFIAMGADHIIARPGTITGSIGVFAGKPVLAEMWDKLDITWDRVATGDHTLMWSANRPFTEAEQAWFDGMLDTIYADFTTKVGASRNLSGEALDQAARGRVFTGTQALEAGLIDALGGLPDAIAAAKQRADIPADAKTTLVRFPERKNTFDALMDMLGDGDFLRAAAVLGEVATLAEPLVTQAHRARVAAQGPAVMAPGH